jgi:DNA-binding beta-propeller fold protein YncE
MQRRPDPRLVRAHDGSLQGLTLAVPAIATIVAALVVLAGRGIAGTPAVDPCRPAPSVGRDPRTAGSMPGHYEYVFPNGCIRIYDIDDAHTLIRSIPLPETERSNVKGVAAHAPTGMLYVSFGGDGGKNGNGSLLKFSLLDERVLWVKRYDHGIDSMAITVDGLRIFMPAGEEAKSSRTWYLVDTATGNDVGSLSGGRGPHNTIVSVSGRHVYLGGREDTTLQIYDVVRGSRVGTVGPYLDTLRPFAIDRAETLVYSTHTGLLGFQVGSITDGRVLYTVRVESFGAKSRFTTPSHGISLSPDEREVYVIDTANAYVHVFDVSRLPASAPSQVASVKLSSDFAGEEAGCGTGWCGRIGWLQHSRDGRFVYVGDGGDVIDTTTRRVVATLPSLRETRKMLEIDWKDGKPVAATPR